MQVAPIAAALAARDARATRRERCGAARSPASAVTWPPCLIGALLAGADAVAFFDSSYDQWATVLVLLIAARAVDAATGPLGEALLVGRRTWVDVGVRDGRHRAGRAS